MRFTKSLIALTVSTTLAACGGSDSPDSNPPATGGGDPTGSETTVYTEGTISGFGSVYVNGQRYRSENANIAIGNNPAAEESGLQVGMVVSLAASSSDNGEDPEATEIRYEEHLQGPVSFIDLEAGVIEILGQQVVFNDLTEFDETDSSTLSINDIVEVSGYLNEDGDFYATRIELEADEDEFSIKGTISALDTSAQTFQLNDLVVDYSSATFDDMATEDLADGLFVKVEGEREAYDAETSTLVATEIENKDDALAELGEADEVKIAGLVSEYNETDGTFKVNRYTFTVTDDTEFDDGPASRLANGVRVKVEAQAEGDQLNAEEIEFIAKNARQKSEGQVEAIDADNQSFTLNGVTFVVDDNTSYLDTSGQGARQFNYADIAVNDWLKVLSVVNDNGDNLAVKVKRSEQEDLEGEVKGVVSEVSAEGMTVAGVEVTFDEQTEFENDAGELTLDEFVALFDGETPIELEVEGEYDGEILIAREVEIEDEDEDGDDDDNGNADKRGKAEFEGSVESIDGTSVMVNGNELRFTEKAELEVNDTEVTVEEFLAAIEVGSVIEVEGVWRDQSYIDVLEAEL
ncbi:DUF5666 domain-containing protein [Idiomarina seosinensis]|uniref:DUF5666 domain-containing protein n=1 Tax=Idiomarina seosinensis TaxID=281739 RepID=UPI00384B0A35